MIPNNQTRLLLDLLRIYNSQGRVTTRDLQLSRRRSLSTIHKQLLELRARGLVAWEPGKAGTLRPMVEVVG